MLTLLALFSSASAADAVPVLVSAFQPRTPEAAAEAHKIEGEIATELRAQAGLKLVRVEDTPKFQDYDARIYINSCPPDQIVGCSLIVAERGETEWAVTGSVRALAGASEIQVSIVNVEESRVAVSFTSKVTGDDDSEFVDGVVKVLLAAVKGEVGQESDIRATGDEDDGKPTAEEKAQANKELAALQAEMGDVSTEFGRSDESIERPTYTMDDIAKQSNTDATKPWERLGMSPGEYLKYKNSGMQLQDWRKRMQGRRGELVLRVGGGVEHGAVDAEFYARSLYNSTTFAVEDVYGAQAQQTGTGASFGGAIGFGVLSVLEVSLQGGITSGAFSAHIGNAEKEGETVTFQEYLFDNWTPYAGARANVVLLPAQSVHPIVGIGALWQHGSSITEHSDVLSDDHYAPLADAAGDQAPFPGPNLFSAEVMVGGELRLSDHVDLFLHVPIDVLLAGGDPATIRAGSGSQLSGLETPAAAGFFAAGAQAGLQIRLFGAKAPEGSRADELDE